MQQKKVKEIISRLALKYNMSVEEMTTICRAPLDFVVYVLKNKTDKTINYFPTIRITGFGLFYVKPGRRKFLENLNEKAKERVQSGSIQHNNGEYPPNTILQGESSCSGKS